jgi:transcriptional regulator of arginine metabolism
MKKYTVAARRTAIRGILRQGAAAQAEIQRALRKRGMRTTQATVSRDLVEMGAVKVRTGGTFRYEIPPDTPRTDYRERLRAAFGNFVTDIKGTGQLILVKTSPGNASGVASLIDALRNSYILGTVAGDDTILVVVDSPQKRIHVQNELHKFL